MSGGKNNLARRSRKQDNFLVEYIRWHKDYVGDMTTGQRIRYYLLQFLVILSIIIILVAVAVETLVVLPDVPTATDRFVTNVPSIDVGIIPGGLSNADTGVDTDEDGSSLVEGLYFDGATFPPVTDSGRREGVYTFLVVGLDDVSNSTDTIILLTYDTVNKTIDAMSLLRDTMVNNSAAVKKLTHVYAYNRGSDKETQVEKGMFALKTHVSRLTGIAADFYVMLQWEAVGELVDAVGGVWYDVPYAMKYDDPAQDLHIDQAAGYRLLDGSDAMEVVRFRQNNTGWNIGDVGRVGIQQDFLRALAETVITTNVLKNAPALAEVFLNNVVTDLSVGNILAFAQQAVGMNVEEGVNFYSMPYYNLGYWNSASYVGVSQSAMVEMVNDGLNPYLSDIRASDLQLMYANKDGSFGVTNAALADSRLSKSTSSSSSSSSSSSTPEPEPEPEPEPVVPETDSSGSGSSSSNSGSSNSGSSNSGSSNSGSTDSGSSNSGSSNSGSSNSGSSNSGSSNSGSSNSGSSNSGSTDSGSSNSGSTDSGSSNSGSTDSGSSDSATDDTVLEILPPVTVIPPVETTTPESQGIPGVDIPVAPSLPDSSAGLEVIPPTVTAPSTEPDSGTVLAPPSVPSVDDNLASAG